MRWSLTVAVLFVAPTIALRAQALMLSGVVRSASDSAPVARAQIMVRIGELSTLTNDDGTFSLERVPAGALHIQVRRLGFRAVDTTLTLQSDSSLIVWMKAVPRRLAEVEVKGHMVMIPAHMRAVVERANRNNGTLITSADIEKSFPVDTKSLFYGIAGIHVTTTTIRFIRCEDPANSVSPFTVGPKVHVYVNGSRHTVTGSPYEAREVVQSIHPKDIEMMEIYGGVTRIPAEFLADACAVVAIWTKAY